MPLRHYFIDCLEQTCCARPQHAPEAMGTYGMEQLADIIVAQG